MGDQQVPDGFKEYDQRRSEHNAAYKKRSIGVAIRNTRVAPNRNIDGSPKPTSRINFDRFFVARLRAVFISSEQTVGLDELAGMLAEYTNCAPERALSYLKAISRGEDWQTRRATYWDNLAERALEAQAQQTIEQFESEMNRRGRKMVEVADRFISMNEPKDMTEAILLMKLGQDTTYRANRVPGKISRYLNVGEQPGEQQNLQRQLQEAPKEEYAATAQSDLAALTAEVGADPAPRRSDR